MTLSKNEREKVMKHYDSNGVELLMGRKLFTQRQVEAAVRIQSWWRKAKLRAWFSLISNIRQMAAIKIQRSWRNYIRVRLWPDMIRQQRDGAALLLQARLRGYLVRKRYWHEISVFRMNNCFEYFNNIQVKLQTDAIAVIIRHMREYVKARKEERKK